MLPDTVIDERYRIIAPLGGGGMANVYRAEDVFLHRDVTIKIMRIDTQHKAAFAQRFEQETLAIAALSDPKIVQIYDVGTCDDSQYIVMEYVPGTDLKAYIKTHFPIAYQEVCDVMLQILSAVSVAHQAQIIHCDLKPQNILINEQQQIKITDFGIAAPKMAQQIVNPTEVFGSVHYLSPEQTRGAMVTPQSDIYALGVILYEMLTNLVPYDGETADNIIQKHSDMPIPSVRDIDPRIPQALENVILRATAKLPADRYPSVHAMADDLATVLQPRRANEERFVPLTAHENETRLIPIDEIKSQIKHGILADDETTSETLTKPATIEDKICDYAVKGYPVKTIAKAVERTPRFVRQTLRDSGIYFRDRKRWPWVVLLIIVLIGSTAAVVWLRNSRATAQRAAQQVTLPDVTGMSRDKAEQSLQDLGLMTGSITEATSKSVKAGSVISSDPKAGHQVTKGATVNLVVSTGEEKVRFGDYMNTDYSKTFTVLTSQGYTVTKKSESSTTVPEGQIMSQSVEASAKVNPSTTQVTFVVSTGAQKVTVPDFSKNSNRQSVENWARKHDISVTYNEINDNRVPNNAVLSQSIRANTEITVNDTLMVTISLGPASAQSQASSASSADTATSKSTKQDKH